MTDSPETQHGTTPAPRRGGELLRALGTGLAEAAQPAVGFVKLVGDHCLLLAQAVAWGVRAPFRPHLLLDAAEFIGIGSLPIIILVGAFTGMVTALQAVENLSRLGAEGYAGVATGVALATELGPVLTGLMLAGRAGSGIATELGTMRISEQIDALEAMAVNPIQYLVVPRLIAAVLLGPVLVTIFSTVGMLGGYMVAVKVMGVDHGLFVENLKDGMQTAHLLQGIIKAAIFGLAFSLIGCFQGYHAAGGGRGVGLATTRAVVISSVSILVLDYFLTDILIVVMPLAEK